MQLLKTDDGSYTLLDPQQQETYHSRFGALTESDQVYLRNSGVLKRLQSQQPTSVLEIGFGTGFNFLHTVCHAVKYDCPLQYTAVELMPISREIVHKVLSCNAPQATDLCEFTADAIDQLVSLESGEEQVSMSYDHQTDLHLHRVDACIHSYSAASFDAIYLDAFSKKNNPTLWQRDFLTRLQVAAKPGAKLATYCVNGEFRAALTAAGFAFSKKPGPKGKREVLIAMPE